MTNIYLIHGTWARGGAPWERLEKLGKRNGPERSTEPGWFEEASPFRRALEGRLSADVRFIRVDWTGKNSIRARAEAAETLRAALREGFASYPDERHIVVAHSHRGNAAIAALNGLKRENYPHGLATMATPFLEANRRPVRGGELRFLRWLNGSVQVTIILSFMTLPSLIAMLLFEGILAHAMIILSFLLIGVPAIVYGINTLSRIERRGGRAATRGLVRALHVPRRGIRRAGRPEFFVVRAPGDEATVALGLASFFGFWNRLMWSVVSIGVRFAIGVKDRLEKSSVITGIKVFCGVLFALFVLASQILTWIYGEGGPTAMVARNGSYDGAGIYFMAYGSVAIVFGVTVFVMVCVVWTLSGVLLAPLGPELMSNGHLLILTPIETPAGVPMKFLRIERTGVAGWVKHFIYRSPDAIDALADWVSSVPGPIRTPRSPASSGTG